MSTTTEATRTLLDELAAALVLWAETPAERTHRTEADIREVAGRAQALGLADLAATLHANADDKVVPLPFRVIRIREALHTAEQALAPAEPAAQPSTEPDTRPAFARRRDEAPTAPLPEPPAPTPITHDPRSALEAIDAVEAGLEELGRHIDAASTVTGPYEAAPEDPAALPFTRPEPDNETQPEPRPTFTPGTGTPIFDAPSPAPWMRRADTPPQPATTSEPAPDPTDTNDPQADTDATTGADDTADLDPSAFEAPEPASAEPPTDEPLFESPPFTGRPVADELAELFTPPPFAALPPPPQRPLLTSAAAPAPSASTDDHTPPSTPAPPAPLNFSNWFQTPFETAPAQHHPAIDAAPVPAADAHEEPAPEPPPPPTFANWFTNPFPAPERTDSPANPAGSIDILLSYDALGEDPLADDEYDIVAYDSAPASRPPSEPADAFTIEPVAPPFYDEADQPTVEPAPLLYNEPDEPTVETLATADNLATIEASQTPIIDEPVADEPTADEFHHELTAEFAEWTTDESAPIETTAIDNTPAQDEDPDHFAVALFADFTPQAFEPAEADDNVSTGEPSANEQEIVDAADDQSLFDAVEEPAVEILPEPDSFEEPAPLTAALEEPTSDTPEPVSEADPEPEPQAEPQAPRDWMAAFNAAPKPAAPSPAAAPEPEPEPVLEAETQLAPEPHLQPPAEVEAPDQTPDVTAVAGTEATTNTLDESSSGFTISAEHIDTLMDSVRRLVLGKNRLASLAGAIHAAAANATPPDPAEAENLLAIADEIARVTTDLQSGVMRTRMVTVDDLAAPFGSRLRMWADFNNTPVDLEISGGSVLVDSALADAVRALLSAWADALTRTILKPRTGTRRVRLTAETEGTHIRLLIADDAETFNIAALRASAARDGDFTPDDDDELRDACLTGGITASPFSALATPAAACEAELSLRPGFGSSQTGNTLAVTIPTRSTVISAMMVRVGDATYAIPLGAVVEVVKPRREQVGKVNDQPVLRLRNEVFPVLDLHAALGEQPPQTSPAAVVAQAGATTAVLLVTGLIGQREIVIEDLDASSASGPFSGATIRDDGGVSLILDLPQVLRSGTGYLDPAMLELMPSDLGSGQQAA